MINLLNSNQELERNLPPEALELACDHYKTIVEEYTERVCRGRLDHAEVSGETIFLVVSIPGEEEIKLSGWEVFSLFHIRFLEAIIRRSSKARPFCYEGRQYFPNITDNHYNICTERQKTMMNALETKILEDWKKIGYERIPKQQQKEMLRREILLMFNQVNNPFRLSVDDMTEVFRNCLLEQRCERVVNS